MLPSFTMTETRKEEGLVTKNSPGVLLITWKGSATSQKMEWCPTTNRVKMREIKMKDIATCLCLGPVQ